MNTNIFLIIIGMAIVTYIPRMVPLVFFDAKKIPPKLQAILSNVPYAALGALIFPGILYVHDNMMFGMVGGIIAVIVAYFGANLIIVVLSSIGMLTLLSYIL